MILSMIVYLIAGLGAGIVTGLAGLSAATIITPHFSFCRWGCPPMMRWQLAQLNWRNLQIIVTRYV